MNPIWWFSLMTSGDLDNGRDMSLYVMASKNEALDSRISRL